MHDLGGVDRVAAPSRVGYVVAAGELMQGTLCHVLLTLVARAGPCCSGPSCWAAAAQQHLGGFLFRQGSGWQPQGGDKPGRGGRGRRSQPQQHGKAGRRGSTQMAGLQ